MKIPLFQANRSFYLQSVVSGIATSGADRSGSSIAPKISISTEIPATNGDSFTYGRLAPMGLPIPRFTARGEQADFIRAASRYASWSLHTWTGLPGGYHVRGRPPPPDHRASIRIENVSKARFFNNLLNRGGVRGGAGSPRSSGRG